jgi:hypothetical protein
MARPNRAALKLFIGLMQTCNQFKRIGAGKFTQIGEIHPVPPCIRWIRKTGA